MKINTIDYKIHCHPVGQLQMQRLRQSFPASSIPDIEAHVRRGLLPLNLPDLNDKSVAITAGSRGIANIATVIRTVIDFLKESGARPFIVPAMGSHGGGTAEGQVEVLAEYGITEAHMGAPVVSDMETIFIGTTKSGVKVACDKAAFAADYIVVINRVKAHTDFKAEYESGLCKMMMVGLGKHFGAVTAHQAGAENFGKLLPEAADVFLSTEKILFGVALVENAKEETAVAECLTPDRIKERERELLVIAKELQGRLLIGGADLLIVDEIGKNISGAGLDPNVVGRPATGAEGFPEPPAKMVAALALSHCSGGNAIGVGMTDIVTLELAGATDLASTYTNAMAACVPNAARIPIIANNERDILNFAMLANRKESWNDLKVIHIRNTLELEEIEVSSKMLGEIDTFSDKIKICSAPFDMTFDSLGRMSRIADWSKRE